MPNTAIVPVPKLENDFYDWYARHAEKCQLAASGQYDLVFVGDSITHLFEGDPHWPSAGLPVWQRCYGQRRALNLGFGWDRTQNVLWRLEQGELAGQTPRVLVLNIGTNNLTGTPNARENSVEEIAEGVRAIHAWVHRQAPACTIVQMAVFPRGRLDESFRPRIARLNQFLQALAAENPPARFLDIGPRFLDPQGDLRLDLLPDRCHPNTAGYEIWAAALEPLLAPLL